MSHRRRQIDEIGGGGAIHPEVGKSRNWRCSLRLGGEGARGEQWEVRAVPFCGSGDAGTHRRGWRDGEQWRAAMVVRGGALGRARARSALARWLGRRQAVRASSEAEEDAARSLTSGPCSVFKMAGAKSNVQ